MARDLDIQLQRGDSAGSNAVRIPVINQTKTVDRGPNSPRMQPAQISNDIGRALSNAGGALNDAAKAAQYGENVDLRIKEMEIQQEKEKQTLAAQKAVSESSLALITNFEESQNAAQPGAAGFRAGFEKNVDEHIAAATKDANPYYKQAYDRAMVGVRQHLLTKAIDYEAAEGLKKEIDDIQQGVVGPTGSAKIVNADPTLLDQEIGRWVNTIDTNTRFNPEAKRKMKEVVRSNLVWAAGTKDIETNPEGWNKKLNPYSPKNNPTAPNPQTGGGDFNAIMTHIFKKEGGYAANDGNGHPVNFGINQGANPDIDVKGLTQAQAADIYRERYWNAIGGDKLPANVALMAMDAAVNQGVGFAKDMIAKSGGDINVMAAMRRDRYEEIIQKNPSKAKYAKIWEDRVTSVLKEDGADVRTYPLNGDAQISGQREKIGSPWFDLATFDEQQKFRQYASSKFNELEQAATKERQNIASGLEIETRNISEMVSRGVAPEGNPKTLADFQRAYQLPERAAQAYASYATAWDTATTTAKFNGMSAPELMAVVKEQPPRPNDPDFAVKSNFQQIRQASAMRIMEARQKDPWQFAQATGDFNAGVADPSKQDFGDVIKQRAAALPQLMEKYGVTKPQILTAAEAENLGNRMAQLSADDRIATLKQLRGAIADDGVYAAVLNTLRPDSPVTVMAGNIAAIGGTVSMGGEQVSTDKIASRIARGEDLLNPRGADKKTDGGKGSAFPMPKETDMRLQWTTAIGNAYAGFPDAEAHAYQAYRAYYAARAAEKGLTDGSPDGGIQKEAITAATGGIGQIDPNGLMNTYKLILPYGMPADAFQDKAAALWKRIGPVNGYTRTSIDDLRLRPTGENGKYLVTGADQLAVPGKDGNPIVMDFLAPIMPAPSAPGQSQSGKIRRAE